MRANRYTVLLWASIVILFALAGYQVYRWVECTRDGGAFVRGFVGYTCLESGR